MSKKASLIVGLIILLLSSNNNLLDSVNIPPKEVEVIDLTITEPSEDISKSVSIISDIVKEEEDRINIAVFNKVFADRVTGYEVNQQQLNDIYVLSAKNFFGGSIKDKYDSLDVFLKGVISDVTGDDVHVLSENEKSELSDMFYGISWHLINWGNYECFRCCWKWI